MKTRKLVPALCAGFLVSATVGFGAERTISTPTPSGYVDTESSVNVSLADWPGLGRRVTIDLTAYVTPSNAIQIAFGQDTNSDEDLEPEETWLVLGVDCGVPFAREEGRARTPAAPQLFNNESEVEGGCGGPGVSALPTNTVRCVFRFRQPAAQAERFDFAKVTTRGREGCAAEIAAEIKNPGLGLFLR